MEWHGYYIVVRITANLGEQNWIDLIELIRQIQVNGEQLPQYTLREVGNNEGFIEVIDEDTSIWWSNQYIYEARYAENAVSFDKFANKLSEAFDVPREDISYTTAVQDGTVYATYIYGGQNRFRLGLFGCPNDVDLCVWEQSRQAAYDYQAENWYEGQ